MTVCARSGEGTEAVMERDWDGAELSLLFLGQSRFQKGNADNPCHCVIMNYLWSSWPWDIVDSES